MQAHAHICAHISMLINVSSYTHAHTYTRARTHILKDMHTLFLHLGLLGFDQFYKKKIIFHCILTRYCNNYNLKTAYVNLCKV